LLRTYSKRFEPSWYPRESRRLKLLAEKVADAPVSMPGANTTAATATNRRYRVIAANLRFLCLVCI